MKALLIHLASLFALGTSFNLSCNLPNQDKWYVPAPVDGTMGYIWINRSTVIEDLETLNHETDLIQYFLYTHENPKSGQLLTLGDASSIHKSKFNNSNPTRIIIHGFESTHHAKICTMTRDAYLKTGPLNVICIDFKKIAMKSYPAARYCVPSIGQNLGMFIQFLKKSTGMTKKDLIVFCHSFGVHVAGHAGKYLNKINDPLQLIIAGDPAKPLFSYEDCSARLCKTDADFLMTIKTASGTIGYFEPLGHGTYYVNGGSKQPGCGVDMLGTCAHLKAYWYFAEALVKNDFPTIRCHNYVNAVFNRCGDTYSSVKMGSWESYGEKGIFYVPINDKEPYGKG